MDDKGLVDLKELRKNYSKADFSGKSAYCFVRGNKIIKIYATKNERDFIPVDTRKVHDLSVFKSDTIVFPDEYIYENGRKVGEISQYIRSKSIDDAFDDTTKISKIIDSYDEVLGDLQLYLNIDMVDLCYVNILYSNDMGFHIIDTTEWVIDNKVLHGNLLRFNSSLTRVFADYLEIPIDYGRYYNKIDNSFFDTVKKFDAKGNNLYYCLSRLGSRSYDFLDLLFAYMEACRIYYGKDVETLQEVKEFTKVLKKG